MKTLRCPQTYHEYVIQHTFFKVLPSCIGHSMWPSRGNDKHTSLQKLACKSMVFTKLQEVGRVLYKSNSNWSPPRRISQHEMVSRMRDEVNSTQYLPLALHNKQTLRATMESKSQLLMHMEDTPYQDKEQHDCSQPNLQMTHHTVVCVHHSVIKC